MLGRTGAVKRVHHDRISAPRPPSFLLRSSITCKDLDTGESTGDRGASGAPCWRRYKHKNKSTVLAAPLSCCLFYFEMLVPDARRAYSGRYTGSLWQSVQSLCCHRTDHHVFRPMLLHLLHQVCHPTPEPDPPRGLRQACHQSQGGAHRGGSGGPFLCSGNVNGVRCSAPVQLHVSLEASGSFSQWKASVVISHRVFGPWSSP